MLTALRDEANALDDTAAQVEMLGAPPPHPEVGAPILRWMAWLFRDVADRAGKAV